MLLLPAVARDAHVDRARWAATWVTMDITATMCALVMLLPVAVLSARVRESHWVVARLFVAATEALVTRKLVFCIAIVAVGASPRVEGAEGPRGCLALRLALTAIPGILTKLLFFLLLFVFFLGRCFLACVKLVDPSLDASEMERLATLAAVPECTPLVDWVGADDALLGG